MLNKYFDRITCVCLPNRNEMSKKLEKELNKLCGKLTRFNVRPKDYKDNGNFDYTDIDMPNNWHGRNAQSYNYMQCFFKIIEKAKKDKIKSLLYLEDDVCLLPHLKYFMPVIMDNTPSNWEMIYFGPGHHGSDDQPSKTYKIETPYLYRSELNLGMQAVAISERMYDYLIDLQNKEWLNENPYIDITIAHQFHRGRSMWGRRYCYGAFPYLVCETSGFSYNEYNDVKRPEYELWKGQLHV